MLGIYSSEKITEALQAIAVREKYYRVELISLDVGLICQASPENFIEISFKKEPAKYIKNKFSNAIYKNTIKRLINNLNGKEKLEKYLTLHFLNFVKDKGANLPETILQEMNKFPRENYLERLLK